MDSPGCQRPSKPSFLTQVPLCLVHLVRNSLKYVNYKQRKDVARDLKAMYSAVTVEDAE